MTKKWLFLALFASFSAWASLPPTTLQGPLDATPKTTFKTIAPKSTIIHSGVNAYVSGSNEKNFVANPSAYVGTANWTASNVTVTRDTDAGDKIDGIASFALTSATHTATFTSDAMTLDDNVTGNCEFGFVYKGDATKWVLKLDNGSGTPLAQSEVLTNETGFREAYVIYPCASGYKVQVASTAASPADINVGAFSWGAAKHLGSASVISSWTSYTPTFQGFGTTSNVAVQYRRVADVLEVRGRFQAGTCTAVEARIGLPSGLTMSGTATELCGQMASDTTIASTQRLVCGNGQTYFNYSRADGSNSGFTRQNGNSGVADNQYVSIYGSIKITEWASVQSVVAPDQTDTPWTTETCTGSFTNTTYTCKTRRIGDSLQVQANLLMTGTPGSATFSLTIPGSRTIDTAKISTTTADRAVFGTVFALDFGTGYNNGVVTYGTSTTVHAMIPDIWSQAVPQTFAVNDQINMVFSVPIVGWTGSRSAPLLVNGVVSSYQKIKRIDSATIYHTADSTCGITEIDGDWLSGVTCSSTGIVSNAFKTGYYSKAPRCWGASLVNGGTRFVGPDATITSSNVDIVVRNAAGTALNEPYYIFCDGTAP